MDRLVWMPTGDFKVAYSKEERIWTEEYRNGERLYELKRGGEVAEYEFTSNSLRSVKKNVMKHLKRWQPHDVQRAWTSQWHQYIGILNNHSGKGTLRTSRTGDWNMNNRRTCIVIKFEVRLVRLSESMFENWDDRHVKEFTYNGYQRKAEEFEYHG